jgi:hypothetical protein
VKVTFLIEFVWYLTVYIVKEENEKQGYTDRKTMFTSETNTWLFCSKHNMVNKMTADKF